MALVGFAPTKAYRDDPSKFEVLHVTDGPYREWFVDTGHLAAAGPIVLDTDVDAPIIKALEEYPGFTREDTAERSRTLPATLDEMNQAQLLATPEGHAVEGGSDLSVSKLRSEMAKVRKDHEGDEDAVVEDAVQHGGGASKGDTRSEPVGPSPTTNPDVKRNAELGGAATGKSTDDRQDGVTVDSIKGKAK
jgi:hypothetical protein